MSQRAERDSRVCTVQGNTAFKKGDFTEAIARYKGAYGIEPEMPHYQLNLAAAYLKVQKYDVDPFGALCACSADS